MSVSAAPEHPTSTLATNVANFRQPPSPSERALAAGRGSALFTAMPTRCERRTSSASLLLLCLGIRFQDVMPLSCPDRPDNWQASFDNAGLSECAEGPMNFVTNLKRSECSGSSGLHCIEEATCCSVPSWTDYTCELVDITFDQAGWVSCPEGKFVSGLQRSENGWLSGIELLKCCGDARWDTCDSPSTVDVQVRCQHAPASNGLLSLTFLMFLCVRSSTRVQLKQDALTDSF